MDMRALNYCVHERTGRFINMRAILGHEDIKGDQNLYLQLHGGRGGKCRRWVLNDNDYITQIHYTYDWYDGFVNKVEFVTAQDQYRSIGDGDGPYVSYYYSSRKQFVGFLSYEIDDETFAFGAYNSIRNHQKVDNEDNSEEEKVTTSSG